jgi:hypothetical protein
MLQPTQEQRVGQAPEDPSAEAVKAVQFGDFPKLVNLVESR